MTLKCDYCHSACVEGAVKCSNCGAPVSAVAPDFRFCPHCTRRLLALGSPTCNYCGHNLPDSYIKAREAALRRISDAAGQEEVGDLDELTKESDEVLKRALRGLFNLDSMRGRK
jgi:hypothetical protein